MSMLGCVGRLKIWTRDKGESNSKGDMNIDKNVDAIIPNSQWRLGKEEGMIGPYTYASVSIIL